MRWPWPPPSPAVGNAALQLGRSDQPVKARPLPARRAVRRCGPRQNRTRCSGLWRPRCRRQRPPAGRRGWQAIAPRRSCLDTGRHPGGPGNLCLHGVFVIHPQRACRSGPGGHDTDRRRAREDRLHRLTHGLTPLKFSNRGGQGRSLSCRISPGSEFSPRSGALACRMLASDSWIGRSGPRRYPDRWAIGPHSKGRPDPRHASRRGRAVGPRSVGQDRLCFPIMPQPRPNGRVTRSARP